MQHTRLIPILLWMPTLAPAYGCAQAGSLDTPEAALRTFIEATNRHDSAVVAEAYALELTGQYFHFSDVPIQSYRIVQRLVVDSSRAARWNDQGIVPPSKVGDIELVVEEHIGGRPLTVSYQLRSFDGRWRIYAHSAWGAP